MQVSSLKFREMKIIVSLYALIASKLFKINLSKVRYLLGKVIRRVLSMLIFI